MVSRENPTEMTEKLPSSSFHSLPNPKKVRLKQPRTVTSLPSSPVKKKVLKSNDEEAEAFAPFNILPVDPDDRTLWWKVPGVHLEDFNDWQLKVHRVDDFTSTFCGVIKTSPYFQKISEAYRQDMMKFLNAAPEVFDSIAEHFEAQMNERKKLDRLIVTLNATEIGLFRYGKNMHAVRNVCPHLKGPLAMGDIEEFDGRLCITCPWHHWRFDLATGKTWQPYRADRPAATVFPVQIVEGEISVGFAHYNPTIFENGEF